MKELENEIRQIIDETIGGRYIGKLKVEKDNEYDLWMLLLFLDREMTPLVLAYEGTVDSFKEFIRKEIKQRKLQMVKFWKGIQELPTDDDE